MVQVNNGIEITGGVVMDFEPKDHGQCRKYDAPTYTSSCPISSENRGQDRFEIIGGNNMDVKELLRSFLDIFKGRQYKRELTSVQTELDDLKATFTPEMTEASKVMALIRELTTKAAELDTQIAGKDSLLTQRTQEIASLDSQIAKKKSEMVQLDEEAELQSFGLYRPKYDFAASAQYKARLASVRESQKAMVKNGTAVVGNMGWTVNGNASQGKKMVKDMQKLLLRAFNSECDELIDNVKFNTFDTACKRMKSSFDAISKLGSIMSVAITSAYYNLKYEELCLAFEYRQKKHEDAEEQKAIRARMREEAKLQREIEDARRRIEKEQKHYTNELKRINEQIAAASESELADLLDKKNIIESQLSDIDKSIKDIDYRETNARAGYVYVISNIGSFGENIYKIGMTRRLDPMERVSELGDASVPFDFDVHAMIFSDDAPALEAALHRAFENKKLNMVNHRREFFAVTLDEIETVVRQNYDKTVEFTRLPEAEQYRTSLKIKESM